MNEQPKTNWCWRLLRWGLIGTAVLVTLAAMAVTEENWRAKRAWENYRLAAEARGEHFDLSDYAAASVPDDQNFAKAPIFASIYNGKWNEKDQVWVSESNTNDPINVNPYLPDASGPEKNGDWTKAELTPLEEWQALYRNSTGKFPGAFPVAPQAQSPAADVLLALSKYDASIEALRVASQRPLVQFDLADASDSKAFSRMLDYLSAFKRFTQVLRLRATAELADNRGAAGLADVQLLLRLDDELRSQPLLIDQLVALAINALTVQPLYEGLVQHRWNDAQLAELEKTLAARDFLADYQRAIHGEQAFVHESLENQRLTREYKVAMDDGQGKTKIQTVSLRHLPTAFFYENELATARLTGQVALPLVDVTNRLISPTAVAQASADVSRQLKHFSLYKLEGMGALPGIIKTVKKFAVAQSSMDLAQVACALERYRLANSHYPETFDALAPQYIASLPHDIINGQPLHYHRTAGENYILYSVGWNEKDDGGQVVLDKKGMIDRDRGDWVWNSAAK
jgi:hypothetical protein